MVKASQVTIPGEMEALEEGVVAGKRCLEREGGLEAGEAILGGVVVLEMITPVGEGVDLTMPGKINKINVVTKVVTVR